MKCGNFITSCCIKEKKIVSVNPFVKKEYIEFIKNTEIAKEIELVKLDIKEADEKFDA